MTLFFTVHREKRLTLQSCKEKEFTWAQLLPGSCQSYRQGLLPQSYRGRQPDAGPQVLINGRKQALGRESAETDLLSSYILPNSQKEAWQLTDLVCAEYDTGPLEMALFQCSQEMGKS